MEDSKKIEELLHYFRMEQKDFAEKCGIGHNNVTKIKTGRCGISKRVFNKIIEAFPDVNKNWLANGEEPMITNSQNIKNMDGNANNSLNIGRDNNAEIHITSQHVDGFIRIMEKSQEQTDRMLSVLEKIINK